MKKTVSKIAEKGFFVSPELEIDEIRVYEFIEYLLQLKPKPFIVSKTIYNDFLEYISQKKYGESASKTPAQEIQEPKTTSPEKEEVETPPEEAEKPPVEIKEEITIPLQIKGEESEYLVVRRQTSEKRPDIKSSLKIKKNYNVTNKRTDISDWVTYYNDRYMKIRDLLQTREELRSVTSISRTKSSDGRQKVAVIGMVQTIRKTFSGSVILTLEDPTGMINVSMKKEEVAKKVGEIVEDEVIGIVGTKSKDIIFAEKVIFPEIPERPIKKSEEEGYAAFISDIHAGSFVFLANEFRQFVEWLNCKTGSPEQKEIASKVRYLFVGGDLVDGVGVYPGQEKELLIQDIYAQYKEVAKYFAQIPEDIHIVIIPGNHDALKIAEPQHPLFKDICAPLYDIKNVTMLSNPSYVNIHGTSKFPGFDVLNYHGVSFDHMISEVPELRKYGYERADKTMEFMLKKRHLAPTHGATRIDPTPQDFLYIDKIPDIFATGHIHYTNVGRYKSILTLNSGCFQDKTEFQTKLGHNPTPGRVPVVNLQTNPARIMRFK